MNSRIGMMIGAALIIILGLVFFIQKKGASSLAVGSEAFAIRSADEVGSIRIRSIQDGKKTETLSLERSGDGWMLNEEEAALAPKVGRLLSALEKQRIRQTVTDAGKERATELLDRGRLEVSLRDTSGKLIREFDIGVQTQDNKGTVMRLKGDATPYIVAIPGVSGYLNSYFVPDPKEWRENLLFNAHFDEIKSVKIEFLDTEDEVLLERKVEGWDLNRTSADGDPQGAAEVENYISLFDGKIYGESFAMETFPTMTDSLKKRQPDMRLSITGNDGKVQALTLYVRPENRNNYFGFVEGDPRLRTVQTFVIDKFMRRPSDW